MKFVTAQLFKVKCQDCHYRGEAGTQDAAVELAKGHIGSDWRTGTFEHNLKISESLLVSRKDEDDE